MAAKRSGWWLACVTVLGCVAATSALAAEPACAPVARPPTQEEFAAAARNPRDRGALWTIEKDGRRSWLYGTIHGNAQSAMPGPRVREALHAADVIALELDVSDPATLKSVTAPPDPAQTPVLSPVLIQRLKAQAHRACVPWGSLSTMPPLLVATILSLLDARWEGLDPAYASEFVLVGFARATQKPVRALETVADQRQELMGGSPGDQIATVEAMMTALEEGRARPMYRALARVWEAGDLAALARVDEWCGCISTPEEKAQFEKALFKSDRNPGLAAAIDALHRQGQRVFAAAGIAHMVGPDGLPTRLGALGYRVERVLFDTQ